MTHLYTDYNGFWYSGDGAINSVRPDYSHDLLAYRYNNTIYSTGVNDALLTLYGFTFEPKFIRHCRWLIYLFRRVAAVLHNLDRCRMGGIMLLPPFHTLIYHP